VERQLKERLIGAAVLVAIAVIMVPEMFSGPRSHQELASDAVAPTGQLKTYRVELQAVPHAAAQASASPVAPLVEAPAAHPQDELANASTSSSSGAASGAGTEAIIRVAQSSASSVVSSAASAASAKPVESRPIEAKPSETKPPPAKSVETKSTASTAVSSSTTWVVQVGSFGTREKAQQIVGTLKSRGYSAFTGPVTVGSKTLYRVRVGAATDRPSAEGLLQKLKASYPESSVVPATR
jgi:DedD protein